MCGPTPGTNPANYRRDAETGRGEQQETEINAAADEQEAEDQQDEEEAAAALTLASRRRNAREAARIRHKEAEDRLSQELKESFKKAGPSDKAKRHKSGGKNKKRGERRD